MSIRLPNAPLIEVVFEMRWALEATTDLPLPVDPGYATLLDAFDGYAQKKGFDRLVSLRHGYGGLGDSVSRRYYKGEDSFPLLQLGHGIFAANASTEYEWKAFKKFALDAASFVVANYPKFKNFNFSVRHLELRYTNAFEEALADAANWIDFFNKATTGHINLPDYLNNTAFKPERRGRFLIESDTKNPRDSIFSLELASARKADVPALRMTNKVFKFGEGIIPSTKIEKFGSALDGWLEAAHNFTSESFKQILTEEFRQNFR